MPMMWTGRCVERTPFYLGLPLMYQSLMFLFLHAQVSTTCLQLDMQQDHRLANLDQHVQRLLELRRHKRQLLFQVQLLSVIKRITLCHTQ